MPAQAYYGPETARAVDNFPISGIRPLPEFLKATILVKKAAAEANLSLGLLDEKVGRAIASAADEILNGALHDQFVVDVFQAGAGTSHNMNANEVLANRAIEILGGRKGDYKLVSPHDHVNMGQSTNDTYPTFIRVASVLMAKPLIEAVASLKQSFDEKAKEFDRIVKSGRTHLQDAGCNSARPGIRSLGEESGGRPPNSSKRRRQVAGTQFGGHSRRYWPERRPDVCETCSGEPLQVYGFQVQSRPQLCGIDAIHGRLRNILRSTAHT